MYKNKEIVVVVPAYNEETQIKRVIETMPGYVDSIVVVNDCSTDKTAATVVSLQAEFSSVVLINHEVNQGVGGAIATGYKWARDKNADVAVVMAGDGQMDPSDLPAILDPIVEGMADYSKGNRLTTGEAFKQIPKVRYFGNSILTMLTKIASGYWHVTDSQTGYTAINKKALQSLDWDDMYKRYGQPNDLLVKLNVYNFKVVDVPIRPVYNIGEKSGIRIQRVIFSMSWLLFKLYCWRMKEKYIIRDFHPLVFFYFLSFILILCTGILSVRLIYLWYLNGHAPYMTSLALFFSATMGLQTAFLAMWMDSDYNKKIDTR